MQLSKGFNFDDNSIFNDNLLHQDPSPYQHSSVHQENDRLGTNNSPQQESSLLNSINQIKFFQQYKKIYCVSYHLSVEKKRLAQLTRQLQQKMRKLQANFEVKKQRISDGHDRDLKRQENSSQQNRVKRSRRTAEMIQKKFKCEVQFCERFYGSQGSLQQHIKLKHPELYNAQDFEYPLSRNENDSL